MDRIEQRLKELQQELLEIRNLTIKSDHAVRRLSGEMRELTRSQEENHKRTIWSSSTAYILFTVLAVGGLTLFFKASTSRTSSDVELLEQQMRQSEKRIMELETQHTEREQSEKIAWNFYQKLEHASDEEVVKEFVTVRTKLTDRVTIQLFQHEVDRRRERLADFAYEEGFNAYKKKQWAKAEAAFDQSLQLRNYTQYAPQLHFYLGDTLYHMNKYAPAARHYRTALSSENLNRDMAPRATYRLGESYRAIGRDAEALEAYQAFQKKFPTHAWNDAAQKREAAMEKKLEQDGE